jgi:hypothetical protein
MSYFKISGSHLVDSAAAVAAASGVGGYIAYVQGGVTILGGIAAVVLTLVTARYWWTRTALLTKTTEAEQKRLDDYRDFVVHGGDASDILEKILSDEKLLKALQEALDRA